MNKENNSLNEFKEENELTLESIYKTVQEHRSEESWKDELKYLANIKHLIPEDEYNEVVEDIKRRYNG